MAEDSGSTPSARITVKNTRLEPQWASPILRVLLSPVPRFCVQHPAGVVRALLAPPVPVRTALAINRSGDPPGHMPRTKEGKRVSAAEEKVCCPPGVRTAMGLPRFDGQLTLNRQPPPLLVDTRASNDADRTTYPGDHLGTTRHAVH